MIAAPAAALGPARPRPFGGAASIAARRLAAALALTLLGGAPAAASASASASTRDAAALRGVLRRAGDRAPLAGVAVLIYPAPADARLGEVRDPQPPADPAWLRRVETDEAGAFAVDDLPPGRVAIEVVVPDYLRARWIVDPARAAARRRDLQLFLRRDDASRYRTTVVRRRPQRPIAGPAPAERQLSREEIRTLPGSQGDPLRALQSLPGVARAPFGAGLLVLRGANPRQSLVYVGDHPVPFAFHLSGLSSVLPPGALDELTFAPSNFAPAFGNASGGLVSLSPRAGRRDAYRGEAFLDLGGVGGLAEGPAGKGSFLVAVRRSHLDLPLRAYAAFNPYAPIIYPSYYDYQAFYDRPLGGGRRLHVGFIGAGDRLSFQTAENRDGEREPYFEPRLSFHRADLAYRATIGDTSVLLTPALRLDTNRLVLRESEAEWAPTPRRAVLSTWRAQLDHRPTDALTLSLGADAELGRQTGEAASDVTATPLYGAAATSNTTSLSHAYLGLYAEATYRWRGATIAAGTRFSAFVAEGIDAFAVDPRLRLRSELGERWTLVAAVGSYTQPWIGQVRGFSRLYGSDGQSSTAAGQLVLPDQIQENFDPSLYAGELALRPLRALQASAGATLRLDRAIEVEGHAFVRDLTDSARPQLYSTAGELAYGGEFIVRKRLTRRVYGWLAYTLMWARRDLPQPDGAVAYGPSPYDQRHNLVAVLSARLPRGWQLGGRFRLSSGLPYTPVVGALGEGMTFFPIYGEPLRERFPLFHQLDVRVDKRWVLRRTIVSAYLDVLNVYNQQNTEAYFYSVDFRRRVGGLSMPILPLVGVRVEL
ncbi:MAG: hypothetical protein R3A79_12065 [Nannocystaceae bacterium]